MPNLTDVSNIPGGYFWNSDNLVVHDILNIAAIVLPQNTILHFGIINNIHYYKLTNLNNYKVSLLRLVPETLCQEEFLRISKVGSRVKRKQYAITLYLAAIYNSEKSIISDTSLTISGSYNIWRKLFRTQLNLNYQISYLNTNDCDERFLTTKIARTQLWGFDEGLLEIIRDDFENLEMSYDAGDISIELFEYLRDFYTVLNDKKNIRLIARM